MSRTSLFQKWSSKDDDLLKLRYNKDSLSTLSTIFGRTEKAVSKRIVRLGLRKTNYKNVRTHGLSTIPEYRSWVDMKRRCYNPDFKQYKDYGGRGISVCSRWLASFEAFYVDMGPRPAAGYTLDRIDNDGNYESSNCRWATRKEQAQSRRPHGS